MSRQTIEVMYSCDKCGIFKRKLNVPVRGPEDVTQWLDQTVEKIAADHFARSPFCKATTIKELMIPTPEGIEKIGGLPEQKA